MGVIRNPQKQFFIQQERMIEENPHQVYVIQDKRALRDMARELGVEFDVGDKEEVRGGMSRGKTLKDIAKKHQVSMEHLSKQLVMGMKVEMEHTSDIGLARKIAKDHLVEDPNYYTKLRKMEKPALKDLVRSQEPALYIDLEKGKKGEEVYPHEYRERHLSPGGNWVYIYEEPEEKKTGFPEKPVPQAKPPEEHAGKKRGEMRQELKESPSWLRDYAMSGLAIPASTQKAMQLASEAMGGRKAFQERVDIIASRNQHITSEKDKAFLVEAVSRDILQRKKFESGKNSATPDELAKRPGGYSPDNPAFMQVWQLSPQEFETRRSVDRKLEKVDHKQEVSRAIERGEHVPWGAVKPYQDLADKYTEKREKPKLAPATEEYVQKYRKWTGSVPKKFEAWVSPRVKKEGDSYLLRKKASGYNIDSYEVADEGIYSHMMTADEKIISYHMYAQSVDHGEELLAVMHEQGLSPEYTVVKRASAVFWDDNWGPLDKEQTFREVDTPEGKKKIAYSSDYILAFRPQTEAEGEAITKLIQDRTNTTHNPSKALPHSYYVPDVRSSKKVDAFDRAFLNVKRMGRQELCILTKNDWIRSGKYAAASSPLEARLGGREEVGDYDPDFRREYTWIDRKQSPEKASEKPTLADVVKSLESEKLSKEILFVKL